MAILWGRPSVQLKLGIELSEEEVRALYEITRYDIDAFLKTFYEKMGKVYLEPHEQGLRIFFVSFEREAAPWLHKVDEARKTFEK